MKTVVYLDELLAVNYLIALFLLAGAGLLCASQCRFVRLTLGAGAAALSTFVLFLPRLPFAVQLALRAVCCAVCVGITYPHRTRRTFAQLCGWYLALNLALTGLVTALVVRCGIRGAETNNLIVYFQLSPLVVGACVGVIYLALRGLVLCFERPETGAARGGGSLSFETAAGPVCVAAFCDTGFALEDPFTARPCVMVCAGACTALAAPLRDYLARVLCAAPQGESSLGHRAPMSAAAAAGGPASAASLPVPDPAWRLRFITCGTAAGSGVFPAVWAKKVTVRTADGRFLQCGEALAVFCPGNFLARYDGVYGPALAGAAEERRILQ